MLMIAAKNKYDNMVEKGIWNAPTAEEKIVALEAKLTSTMKNLNKKVSFELGKKGKGGGKSKPTDNKGGKQKNTKSGDGNHPKHWPTPKPGDKKTVEYKGYDWHWCGKDTGGKCEKWRAHEPNECRGAATHTPAKTGKRSRRRSRHQSQRNSRWRRHTSQNWNKGPLRTRLRTTTVNDG
jgi:hypothetical protein